MTELLKKVEFYRQVALNSGNFNRYVSMQLLSIDNLVKDVFNTTHIEGNTISHNDTLRLLTGVATAYEALNKYKKNEVFELAGMKQAIYMAYNQLCIPLSHQFIMDMHYKLYKPVEDIKMGVYAGEYRYYDSRTFRKDSTIKMYLDYHLVEEAMQDLIYDYNMATKNLHNICMLKLRFIHIHPFGDGNGRSGRLLMNWALISSGYLPIVIPYTDKREYIDSMDYFGSTGDSSRFEAFICNKLIEAYKSIA